MPTVAADPVQDALCARLRGERVPLSPEVVTMARRHRVHLILANLVEPKERDEPEVALLMSERVSAALVDAVRTLMLRELLDGLGAAAIRALILKGAGLAHSVYSASHLRPREDLDVLIPQDSLGPAERLLTTSGWTPIAETSGDLLTSQRHYVRHGPSGLPEQLDLHWRIANPHVFRDAVSFDELWSRSIPVPGLGPHARTLSVPDALFLACVHRVAHHQDELDLLWLWDIHLLVSRLSSDDRTRFIGLAERPDNGGMRSVCLRGIELARARFGTPADDLIARLRDSAIEHREASSRFIGGGLTQADLLWSDLTSLPGWRDRVMLVGQHLFPSSEYMRSAYPRWRGAALPLAYVHRMVKGAPKWFRARNKTSEP